VILFDKRGTGMSDRDVGIPDIEQRMDDIRAVMDEADSERAALIGTSDGGTMSALFAATFPGRCWSLILWGSMPRYRFAPDYRGGVTEEEMREAGTFWAEHPWEDRYGLRGLAEWCHIEEFLHRSWEGAALAPEPDRMLSTILFTDVVGSTRKAFELGDRRWRELLERHHATIRFQLARYRGIELDTAGDGFFASFDGPARAIRCASAIRSAVHDLGIEVRAGIHACECELIDRKPGGVAVHIGARVAAEAEPGDVLVSQTVKDLVAGSGIQFEDRGVAELRDVPGEWRLYALASLT
jgi:class 3 adenylate cyclase